MNPVAPAVRHLDRTVKFLDLSPSATRSWSRPAGSTVPGLRDRTLGDDERTMVHENVARVRAGAMRSQAVSPSGAVAGWVRDHGVRCRCALARRPRRLVTA
ncbi:DUF6192 family protein [Streptomyces sp. NPDC001708]|uniref:DUF6192 family protein n=1 Tax=Streptomyces sp. NPDC001708 TaxID=3364602 RepID=UPI0036A1630D